MVARRIALAGVSARIAGLQWDSDRLLRIGRQENLDIVLNEPSISRNHAEVAWSPRGWTLRDLGSSSGTLLNGKRLGHEALSLRLDDVIQFGNLAFKVSVLEDDRVPAEPRPADQVSSTIKASGRFVKVQAIAQHSWEKALETVALDPTCRPQQGQHLVTLLRAGYHLGHIASLDELLDSILSDAVKAVDAQRAAIVLMDEATGTLKLRKVALSDRPVKSNRAYSKTLAERSFNQGQSMLCQDVQDDADLQAAFSVAHGTMSSIICAVLRSPRKRLGVLHLDRGPMQEPFSADDFRLADAIAASVSVGIESAQMVERERDQFIQTVTALARTVEVRDEYTANHTQRVTDYALLIAKALRLSQAAHHEIQIGTPLHDIGKIGVPDAILRKPGQLTREEFEMMKAHTTKGAAILESIPALAPMLPIVRNHHERWDGLGYPDGLSRDRISQSARIVAVADAFDAMTSNRPYRKALATDAAFAELIAKAGTHFDPVCAEAFVSLRPQIEAMLKSESNGVATPPAEVPDFRLEQMLPGLATAVA